MKQDRITARTDAAAVASVVVASVPRPDNAGGEAHTGPSGRDLSQPDRPTSEPDGPNPDGPDLPEAPRDLWRALRRGWRRTCPACGGGPVFDRYLSVRKRCVSCGEPLDRHAADDAPTWLTIMVVGHLVAPLMLFVWGTWNPPLWVHWTVWPPLTLLLTLALLPRFKAMVVALQWAKRMAGFDDAPPRG